jgi:hypothetical protein
LGEGGGFGRSRTHENDRKTNQKQDKTGQESTTVSTCSQTRPRSSQNETKDPPKATQAQPRGGQGGVQGGSPGAAWAKKMTKKRRRPSTKRTKMNFMSFCEFQLLARARLYAFLHATRVVLCGGWGSTSVVACKNAYKMHARCFSMHFLQFKSTENGVINRAQRRPFVK